MKAKQVYDSIDQSKATKEVNAFLEKVKTATKNFTVENESVDKKMNELYEKIKATKPDILKGYKEPKAAKEPKAPRATTSKPRTPRAKKPARKPTVSSVAKKIRKKGESWNDALKRASSVFKEQQEDKRLKSREAMQELQKFMNDDKFKNWPRTYGKEKASGNDLMRDNARKAKAPGKRVSKSGRVYWENRDNRSDREASAFPRKIYLKDGGDVDYRTHNLFELGGEVMVEPTILQNNPDYITSTATMSDYFEKGGMMGVDVKKRFDVDFYKNSFDRQTSQEEIIRGDKFSDIVAQATKIAKSKGMNRVEIYYKDLFIGSMRMEDQFQFVKGRSSSKSPLPVDEFAKGGKLKYDPSRDVEAIVIQDGTFKMMFKKDDFIGGAYQMEKGGLSEKYNYVSPRNILFARLKTGEEIKPVNGFWIKKNATGIVYVEDKAPVKVKKKSALGVSVPRPIMVSGNRHKDEKLLKMLNDFTASDDLRPALSFVALKDGDIVATDAYRLIRLIDGSTVGMNEGVCMKKLCSGIDYKELNFPSYKPIIQGLSFDHSEDYDLTDLYQKVYAAKKEGMAEYDSKRRYQIVVVELELKNETLSCNAELLLKVIAGALKLGWKNAFISYTEGNRKAIIITEERPSSMRGFEGKDLILLMPLLPGGDFPTKKVKAEEVFELGGEVMVEPTILQNNPDYITSTATMSDYFAKGGFVGKGEMVWRKLTASKRGEFLYENFTPQITPRTQEILVNKDYQFLPREVKMTLERVYANVENYAKGGAMEHMIMRGDKVLQIHKNMVIVESDLGQINVLDLSTEPIARRISIEPITGKNTLQAAMEHIDYLVSRKPKTMAMGGSLQGHGLKEGDLIVEDLGSSIMVLDEDGETFYVDLREGERYSEEPLPFDNGGEVKIGDIARLAAKYNKTGQEVAAAISEGADVEVEHTEDRKKAMRIAVDHLEEDFYYYPKLKAVENKPDFSDYYEKGGEVPEEFLDSKGVRKIDPKSIKELTDFVMALPQTKSLYFNEVTGEYVPSRKKLHAEIINTFKKDVVCITEDQPIAIFMGGSPASGKSSFLRKYSPYLLKEEILKVDADEIRAMLPEYQGYNAAQTHSETKDIVSTLLSNKNIGIPCDFDLIYDGTMNSVKSYIPLMDILRKRGYKIFIVYMDKVPKDVIIKRALERYQKSGRFVPLEVIEDFFEKGRTAFDDLKKDVDGYMVIDGSNQDYEIIERGGMKLPTNREYSKLGTKIDPKDIPAEYKRGGMTKKA